ncbi:glycosyltransferase involved in cell wall biosynthesis [Paenibacillus taihuensis]|uniref:Glycosyltransferase involved in cell wall biosynthesis n=1 Tax=Paenibacillus taihuensis TaxID=1156355 RepID=A0A3D9SNV9_9BACL|nr:glycosyltransferase family 4 protein [Paenibacillus taihuensis]REE91376.1 glycosyltransferase involved in cell wall biosynthesis [Paenibacillus taihuensis]
MRTVTILTHSYLNGYAEGEAYSRPFGGGLERYIYDLCGVIQSRGWRAVVHQLSYFNSFETTYLGVFVRGYKYELNDIAGAFERMAADAEGLVIYGSCLWHPIRYRAGSIGICHGVNWDWHDMSESIKADVAVMIQGAVSGLDRIVSVDSHFQTYCRACCSYDDAERLVLLPNAVDTVWFKPLEGQGQGPGQEESEVQDDGSGEQAPALRLLYPRRLSYERGIVPMMLITDRLLRELPTLTVEFAGELVAGTPVAVAFQTWLVSHPHRDRIVHRTYAFNAVRDAYQAADVAVIPTVYSEGTSLSCLEAMSCGVAVVATNVGGLNDLIIDGYNGLRVPPTEEALYRAVKQLLVDESARRELAMHARGTAAAFDLAKWQRRWGELLEDQLGRVGM